MASRIIAKAGYRKAKCCLTCSHRNNSFCGVLCMPINLYSVCNVYNGEQGRAARKTDCKVCAFGPNGDHSCETGMNTRSRNTGCFAGKRIRIRRAKAATAVSAKPKRPRKNRVGK